MVSPTAFLSAIPLSRSHRRHITTRNCPTAAPIAPHVASPCRVRRAPVAQGPGNIEDIPLEVVPHDMYSIPDPWHRPGVYGIYAKDSSLQYVAAVANVAEAIAAHIHYISESDVRHSVRMITVDNEDDAPLGLLAENWVMAHMKHGPGLPVGNSSEDSLWLRDLPKQQRNVYFFEGTPVEFAETEIKSIIRDHPVVLFMKGVRDEPRCQFSAIVVDLLQTVVGDSFVCVDCLDELRNRGLRESIKQFSKWPTIPQLYVNGDFVGGADIVQEMSRSGELKRVLEKVVLLN